MKKKTNKGTNVLDLTNPHYSLFVPSFTTSTVLDFTHQVKRLYRDLNIQHPLSDLKLLKMCHVE